MSRVTSAIEHIGTTKIARRVKLRPSAVQKWRDQGRLPRTDLIGHTHYARQIAALAKEEGMQVTVSGLLRDTRKAWALHLAAKSQSGRHLTPGPDV